LIRGAWPGYGCSGAQRSVPGSGRRSPARRCSARFKNAGLTGRAGNYERLNAVLRFLFAAIRIGESRAPSGKFDHGRIEIEQNDI
jgi:hypothetical protein